MMSIRYASSLLLSKGQKNIGSAAPALQLVAALPHRHVTTTSPAYRRYLQQKQRAAVAIGSGSVQTPPSFSNDAKQQTDGHKTVPTIGMTKTMPSGFSEMENEPLLTIAEMGNHSARIEVLKRHIMMVDQVDYEQATKTFQYVAKKNREGIAAAVLPYQLGIGVAIVGGFGSIPMVFDMNTAMWFNHHFVTMEIPEPSDLDTFLEVGAWTWNWMEPVLGTASFVLLCLQFSR